MILKCPACAQKFRVEMKAQPRFCPLCGYDTKEDEARREVVHAHMLETQSPPHYPKVIRGVVDKVYKDIETTSETRVQMAAQLAGCDPADLAGMKVTNIKDSAREGENSLIPVVNDVSRAMAAAPQGATGFTRTPDINQYSVGAQRGPFAGSGLGQMKTIQDGLFNRSPEHFDGVRR